MSWRLNRMCVQGRKSCFLQSTPLDVCPITLPTSVTWWDQCTCLACQQTKMVLYNRTLTYVRTIVTYMVNWLAKHVFPYYSIHYWQLPQREPTSLPCLSTLQTSLQCVEEVHYSRVHQGFLYGGCSTVPRVAAPNYHRCLGDETGVWRVLLCARNKKQTERDFPQTPPPHTFTCGSSLELSTKYKDGRRGKQKLPSSSLSLTLGDSLFTYVVCARTVRVCHYVDFTTRDDEGGKNPPPPPPHPSMQRGERTRSSSLLWLWQKKNYEGGNRTKIKNFHNLSYSTVSTVLDGVRCDCRHPPSVPSRTFFPPPPPNSTMSCTFDVPSTTGSSSSSTITSFSVRTRAPLLRSGRKGRFWRQRHFAPLPLFFLVQHCTVRPL